MRLVTSRNRALLLLEEAVLVNNGYLRGRGLDRSDNAFQFLQFNSGLDSSKCTAKMRRSIWIIWVWPVIYSDL